MFRSFQARLLFLFLGLFAAVLTVTLFFVNAANTRNARGQIDDALEVASGVFHELIDGRNDRLVESARLLSGDFAFKSAYATGDQGTVRSALGNHRDRIGADLMLLVSLDYEVLVDTRGTDGIAAGAPLPLGDAIDAALDAGEMELSTIAFLDDVPYQVVVVPLLVPAPDGWICVGFRIDDAFAEEFRRLTLSHVTVLANDAGADKQAFRPVATTLDAERLAALPRALAAAAGRPDESVPVELGGESFVTVVTLLPGSGDVTVLAALQRSMAEALAPYLRLRQVLILLLFGSLGLCALVGMRVARSVSRPVLEIADAAGKVRQGDFSERVTVRRNDEIGRLAESFNHMVTGLEERNRVRSLLGKVVSPAVAQELMRKEIELGGEEREVTVLFSDVRDFTAMCEGAEPGVILARLNRYLTAMSGVVDGEGGVVDKYVGDAIMALFGAPLQHPDDAARAVRAALGMQSALETLNAELQAEGAPELRIGIGINTGVVVAGNMGSQTRLNYTVIGDGVNLAARLEGLTKVYGVGVLVSDATRAAAPDVVYREVDRVRVKGKQEPVTIHEPLGTSVGAAARATIDAHHAALEAFRRQEWDAARDGFLPAAAGGDPVARLYLDRIEAFRQAPPDAGWDGTTTHTAK